MASIPAQSLADNWQEITISQADLQNLTNTLFEREEPMDIDALSKVFVATRIKQQEAAIAAKIKSLGKVYLPKDSYTTGETLVFPLMNWQSGEVLSVRPGVNPQLGDFDVMMVSLENGSEKQFAAKLPSHSLNTENLTETTTIADKVNEVLQSHGRDVKASLLGALQNQSELVRIGTAWFPQSLLVDMHKGQLNLVEALLDSQSGGPLSSAELIQEMELKSKDNPKLIEFSLNYALQEDSRFDEVGTSGKYSWFLRKLEPKYVLEKPLTLQSTASCLVFSELSEEKQKLFQELNDELSYSRKDLDSAPEKDFATIVLNYPHWRAGSLPITPAVMGIFPSALETEHVKVEFVDDENQKISAWVVISDKYVIGLREWFEAQDLIPGSVVEVSKTDQPGIIRIRAEKKRTNKEWIKTLLIGSDNGFVLLLQRQPISAGFNDRMAIKILDLNSLDTIWKDRQSKKIPLEKDILRMANELARLNNQSHIHFTDLYAAINLVRRVAPHELLKALETHENINYIGDNYYHLAE
ncbi:MAG TPA: hypothetical protein VLR89_06910 [Anaerolineaceae bacterium]|nr:hypothetical protein [Anaerolineaceae bacterium]